MSHDLPGREQQPTGESVDTVRDQKHNTLRLLWAKPLEATFKVNINLKRKKTKTNLEIPVMGHFQKFFFLNRNLKNGVKFVSAAETVMNQEEPNHEM